MGSIISKVVVEEEEEARKNTLSYLISSTKVP